MAENIIGDVITEGGRTIEFGDITSRDCPSCNPDGGREDRKLYIRSSIDNSVTLECKACAYNEHKPVSEVPEALGKITTILGEPIRSK